MFEFAAPVKRRYGYFRKYGGWKSRSIYILDYYLRRVFSAKSRSMTKVPAVETAGTFFVYLLGLDHYFTVTVIDSS